MEALGLRLGLRQLLLGQLPEIRVVEEGLRLLPPPLRGEVGPVGLHHRLELPELPVDGGQAPGVPIDGRVRQLGLQALIAKGQLS